MSSGPKPRTFPATLPWLMLALAAAAGWLWINFCRFPASPWNDVRLAPVFMAAKGVPVYTLPGEGVLTTWMYGPVPLWVWWPATLAGGAISAVLTAGALNLIVTVAAIAATCCWWPAPGVRAADRGFVFAACLALWPDHAFRFLQADNVAVALGLTANLLLVTARPSHGSSRAWIAAALTAAALGCKQTTLGLPVAQFAWLWLGAGRAAAWAHLGRIAATGLILLGVAALQFGPRELWFGLVTVPGALPTAEDWTARLVEMAPHLALQAGLPLAILVVFRSTLLGAERAARLAGYTFLTSLPLGITAVFSTGGTINSFQGFSFILPALLLAGAARSSLRIKPHPALIAGALLLAVIIRVQRADFAPFRPAVGELRQAQALIAARPGGLWLPWNPLVTYFAEGRFDHAEDGIYVRFITGNPVSLHHARSGLPPAMKAMAFPSPAMQWDVAARLAPPDAHHAREGGWLMITWP